MSGGSYDYICFKIQDIQISHVKTDPRRAAFQKLLGLVAEAMHDIEWVDSCDYGKGDEYPAIDKVFSFLTPDSGKLIKAAAYDELSEIVSKFLAMDKT